MLWLCACLHRVRCHFAISANSYFLMKLMKERGIQFLSAFFFFKLAHMVGECDIITLFILRENRWLRDRWMLGRYIYIFSLLLSYPFWQIHIRKRKIMKSFPSTFKIFLSHERRIRLLLSFPFPSFLNIFARHSSPESEHFCHVSSGLDGNVPRHALMRRINKQMWK